MPRAFESVISDLQSTDATLRRQAVQQLLIAAADARAAAVALVVAAGDEDEQVREAAVGALESLGEPLESDVPQLAELLDRAAEQPDVAYWAATLLGRVGEAAAPATPALTHVLRPGSPTIVRQRAAWALGKIGSAGKLGSAAQEAESELRAASASDDPRLARLAAEALQAITAQ